ncbi:MAG: polysaccharide biosynthesis tyrosine autokinase [Planctomycetes bacterium]|nr:polysaccharide biosynthesis tyrosine autokinase [Planctomycetota bacterium]
MIKGNAAAAGRMPRAPGTKGASEPAAPLRLGDVLTPREALGMLRRHLWLIVFVTVIGSTMGTGGWYLVRRYLPLYRAETMIEVLPPIATDPMDIGVAPAQQDVRYRHRAALANQMKSPSTLQQLLQREEIRRTKWYREKTNGGVDIARAIQCLDRHLTALAHREAEHIVVSMTCASPGEAALIVNQIVNLFLRQHRQIEGADVRQKLADATQRQSGVEQEIRQSEADLQNVTRRSGTTDLERPTGPYLQHTITLRLDDLESQESNLSLDIKQLQADIGNLRQLAEGPLTEQIQHALEGDPVLVTLAQQLAVLEAQLSGQLTKFGETHRVVRQTQEQIDEIRKKTEERRLVITEQTRRAYLQDAHANLQNARDKLRVLEERLAELQKQRTAALEEQKKRYAAALEEQKRLDETRREYERIQKVREERIETLNQIRTQIEKYRILLENPQTPKVQSLGPAPEPLEMVLSRSIFLWAPGGTLLGWILGFSLALLVEMLNDFVRTPRDVQRLLHVPLLGVIPEACEDRAVADIDLCDVVREAPYSLLGESYRRCRTNLELSAGGPFTTLLVASGQPGDGKTSLACNLAAAFAAKYERVLLIDANLRQPSLHLVFPPDPSRQDRGVGLTDLLMGKCTYQEAMRPSAVAGLDLIDAGSPVPNPAELLAGPRLEELVETVAERYDRVIIDSPPVLLVSDVKMLARLADATLLVFHATLTRWGMARRTIFEFEEVGARIVGCVLFGAEAMKGGYFRQQFRAYRRYLKPQRA